MTDATIATKTLRQAHRDDAAITAELQQFQQTLPAQPRPRRSWLRLLGSSVSAATKTLLLAAGAVAAFSAVAVSAVTLPLLLTGVAAAAVLLFRPWRQRAVALAQVNPVLRDLIPSVWLFGYAIVLRQALGGNSTAAALMAIGGLTALGLTWLADGIRTKRLTAPANLLPLELAYQRSRLRRTPHFAVLEEASGAQVTLTLVRRDPRFRIGALAVGGQWRKVTMTELDEAAPTRDGFEHLNSNYASDLAAQQTYNRTNPKDSERYFDMLAQMNAWVDLLSEHHLSQPHEPSFAW